MLTLEEKKSKREQERVLVGLAMDMAHNNYVSLDSSSFRFLQYF